MNIATDRSIVRERERERERKRHDDDDGQWETRWHSTQIFHEHCFFTQPSSTRRYQRRHICARCVAIYKSHRHRCWIHKCVCFLLLLPHSHIVPALENTGREQWRRSFGALLPDAGRYDPSQLTAESVVEHHRRSFACLLSVALSSSSCSSSSPLLRALRTDPCSNNTNETFFVRLSVFSRLAVLPHWNR